MSSSVRIREAVGAATRSLALLQRYDAHRFHVNVVTTPLERVFIDKQTQELKLFLAQANYIAGVALVRVRRWEAATKHLADAVEQNPGHAGAWAALGVAANKIGRYDESRRAFEKVLSLDAYFTDSNIIQRLIWETSKDDHTYRLGDHYGLRPVRLCVGDVPPNASAAFAARQNWIILRDNVLDGDHWMTILAHELGHVVLEHDMPIELGGQDQHIEASPYPAPPTLTIEQQLEIDANRKAVEIMTRVVGVPERDAMRKMATFLLAANASRGGRAVAVPYTHIHPCDQFDKLVAGFPQEWSADLGCQKHEGRYRGPVVATDAFLKLTRQPPSSSTPPASHFP